MFYTVASKETVGNDRTTDSWAKGRINVNFLTKSTYAETVAPEVMHKMTAELRVWTWDETHIVTPKKEMYNSDQVKTATINRPANPHKAYSDHSVQKDADGGWQYADVYYEY